MQVRREGGVVNTVQQYKEAMKKMKKTAWRPNFKEIKEKRREERRARKEERGEKEEKEKEERGGVTRELVTRAVNSSYIAQFGLKGHNLGINPKTNEVFKSGEKKSVPIIEGTKMMASLQAGLARDSLLLAPGIKPKVVA